MSSWTYVSGVLTVNPRGRTQAEARYILDTVLAHLPKITGSEGDVDIHVVPRAGYNCSSSHNEFGEPAPRWESFEMQDEYLVVLDGGLRDREFDRTLQEFSKWLTRLASRIWVCDCLVRVRGYDKEKIIQGDFYDWLVPYSWENKGTVNWCEYLLWEKPHDSSGNIYDGKPDFADGRCLELMSDEERAQFWDEIAARYGGKRG